jgi:DNA helicase-2/ATP-dependent DNA helicase PcrA
MEENIFPLASARDDMDTLEEERRLAYVGITRAEQALYLTNANSRTLYGKSSYNRASRFISEIDEDLLNFTGLAHKAQTSFNASYKTGGFTSGKSMTDALHARKAKINPFALPKAEAKPQVDWSIGDKVQHRKWGDGTVLAVSGTGKNMELKINFPAVGMKKLLADIAPIERQG